MHYGDSRVLGLQICWEYGELRWYGPAGQRYLDSFDILADERDRTVAEAQRRRQEIARLRGSNGKRMCCTEVLAPGRMPFGQIARMIVRTEEACQRLNGILRARPTRRKIVPAV